jgi:hypothetical protein
VGHLDIDSRQMACYYKLISLFGFQLSSGYSLAVCVVWLLGQEIGPLQGLEHNTKDSIAFISAPCGIRNCHLGTRTVSDRRVRYLRNSFGNNLVNQKCV